MRRKLNIRIKAGDFRRKLNIKDGIPGKPGLNGAKGDTVVGPPGLPGKNGSPDTPDEVVEKVNTATKKVKISSVKGLESILNKLDEVGKNPVGAYASGGANQMVIQNNGTRLSDFVLNLNFGAGLTASYSNGTILVTANTSGSVLTATGTIDDSNTTFTFTSQPSVLIINGGTYQQTGGSITWTFAGTTATLSQPVGQSGSIFGLI